MKKIVLAMMALLVLVVVPSVLAASCTDKTPLSTTKGDYDVCCNPKNPGYSASAEISNDVAEFCIKDKMDAVINLLTAIAGGVAVIAAMIIGLMFVQSNDPSQKDALGQKLKMLIIGIVLIALANPIVKMIF